MLTNFELVLLSRAREAANEQRQANASRRGFQNLSVFQSGAGQDAASGSMSDVVPVSYTHLDVYKRQSFV